MLLSSPLVSPSFREILPTSRLGIAVLLRTELYWSLFISSSSNNRTCHRQPQSRSRASQPSLCKLQASKSFASNHQTLLESVNGGFVTSIVRSPQKSPPSSLILRQSSQWQAGRFWAPPPTHRLHHYWLAAFHETCVCTAVEHLRALAVDVRGPEQQLGRRHD